MDNITKYLNKIAYKFPKGYPDMNNDQDILLLESLISEVMGEKFSFILETTDAEEGINILKYEFGLEDKDFVKVSNKRYKILVPQSERFEYIQKMDKLKDFNFDPNSKGSSVGAIKFKDSTFLLKPSNLQGRSSAGTENEDILENELKKYLEDGPKDVLFIGSNKEYLAKGVTEVMGVGYDVAGGKKADIVLKGDTQYPISIKKDNAGFWESSDSRYKDIVSNLTKKIKSGHFSPTLTFRPFKDKLGNIKKSIYVMYNEEEDKKVTGVVVTELPSKDEESIIFGSDNAVVIYKSFTPNDFSLEGDIIRVKVSKIIEDLNDVKEFNIEPILNIRHDSTRAATGGLRATVQPENKVYKGGKVSGDKIELKYNDIIEK